MACAHVQQLEHALPQVGAAVAAAAARAAAARPGPRRAARPRQRGLQRRAQPVRQHYLRAPTVLLPVWMLHFSAPPARAAAAAGCETINRALRMRWQSRMGDQPSPATPASPQVRALARDVASARVASMRAWRVCTCRTHTSTGLQWTA